MRATALLFVPDVVVVMRARGGHSFDVCRQIEFPLSLTVTLGPKDLSTQHVRFQDMRRIPNDGGGYDLDNYTSHMT